jgi:hypothetical protein
MPTIAILARTICRTGGGSLVLYQHGEGYRVEWLRSPPPPQRLWTFATYGAALAWLNQGTPDLPAGEA